MPCPPYIYRKIKGREQFFIFAFTSNFSDSAFFLVLVIDTFKSISTTKNKITTVTNHRVCTCVCEKVINFYCDPDIDDWNCYLSVCGKNISK